MDEDTILKIAGCKSLGGSIPLSSANWKVNYLGIALPAKEMDGKTLWITTIAFRYTINEVLVYQVVCKTTLFEQLGSIPNNSTK